jgi:ribonuclease HII
MPDLHLERTLFQRGYRVIVGLDEVGRGAWAGPVVAGAVALPLEGPDLECELAGVRDSKQLSPRQRKVALVKIQQRALAIGIGAVSAEWIDRVGIVPATRQAMLLAIIALGLFPDYLLIDALKLPFLRIPQQALIKGDVQHLSISAASIAAKVARDHWMAAQEERFPGYGFASHKGYGTSLHRQAITRLGPCPLHRLSFAPLRPR